MESKSFGEIQGANDKADGFVLVNGVIFRVTNDQREMRALLGNG